MTGMQSGRVSRRQFLRAGLAAGGGFALHGVLSASPARAAEAASLPSGASRPNVLFIAVDDLRTQLGCYGHGQTLSPAIDRVAAEGIVFGRAYCQVPVCGASRASLMTGIRPDYAVKRFTDAGTRADKDVPDAATLGQHFKSHGYYTVSNGKIFHYKGDSAASWSERPWRVHDYDTDGHGDWGAYHFDKIWLDPASKGKVNPKTGRGPYWEAADVPDEAYEDGRVAAKTIEDLRRLKAKNQPFFLACGFSRPHLPFNAPKRYFDLYEPSKIDLADNRIGIADKPKECTNSGEINSYSEIAGWPKDEAFHRQARWAYYACVSYVDAQIGKVMAELKALELDTNTIVVIWGDHGWHLGEHNFWGKHNTLNNALQVPLIVRAPGFRGNRRTEALVEFVDIYPSLCELAGLPHPASHRLDGKSFVPLLTAPELAWKEAVFSEWHGGKAVKTDRYLYTEWASGSRMLFDHRTDPEENVNIAGTAEHAEVTARLSRLLRP